MSGETDLPEIHQAVTKLVRAALFAALTATGALLSVPLPFSPVPVTLQLMFTLMAGLILGARYGLMSQVVYIAMGIAGLPVFSRGMAGAGVLLGPTGGYLLGFVLAAWLVGFCAQLVRRWSSLSFLRLGGYICATVLGLAIIHLCGVTRLATVLNLSFTKAVAVGVVPFIIPDLIKAVAAAALATALEKRGL